MAPSVSMLSLGCALTAVLGAVPDSSSLVQTSVQSQLAQQQTLMFRMVAEAMGSQASKPHKHHKHRSEDAAEGEAPAAASSATAAEATEAATASEATEHSEAADGTEVANGTEAASDTQATDDTRAAAQKVATTVRSHKKKHGMFSKAKAKPAALPKVEAGCSQEDFDNINKRFNDIRTQHGSSIADSMKENDPNATLSLVQKILPEECNQEKLTSGMGVNFANLEMCLTKGTGVSRECLACPLNFIEDAIGKTLVDVPFTCTMKCMPAASSAFKCGEAADCDTEILAKSAKCMKCVNPKIVALHKCAQLPGAKNTEGRLAKLLKASLDGEDALDELLEAEAADGRDELRTVSDKPPLSKLLAIGFSILVD